MWMGTRPKLNSQRGMDRDWVANTQVSIHVVEELLEAIDELGSEEQDSSFEEDSDTVMTIGSSVFM